MPARTARTLVCMECRRLKTKCDHRSPCDACIKRRKEDTCEYHPEAAEKIDLQSVNNQGGSPPPEPIIRKSNNASVMLPSYADLRDVWKQSIDDHFDPVETWDAPETGTSGLHSASDMHMPSSESIRSTSMSDHSSRVAAFVARLPSDPSARQKLLSDLDCVPIHFGEGRRQRIRQMLGLSGPSSVGSSSESGSELSLFSAALAGFALGACRREDERRLKMESPPEGEPEVIVTPAALLRLSQDAFYVSEDTEDTTCDSVLTHVLHARYYLYMVDLHPSERNRSKLGSCIGRAVAGCRSLGLDVKVENSSFSHYETEMRRRLAWDVFCLETFTSDMIGQAGHISPDESEWGPLPKDVDDEFFLPESIPRIATHVTDLTYSNRKCSLARLTKRTKKHIREEAESPPPHPSQAVIDSINDIQQQIKTFIDDLPPHSPQDPASLVPHHALEAQHERLLILPHLLVLNLYHPFLLRAPSPTTLPHPHTIALSCADAACAVIKHIRSLHTLRQSSPFLQLPEFSLCLPYPLGRILFHAFVVLAHLVVQFPQTQLIGAEMQSLRLAFDLLNDSSPEAKSTVGRLPKQAITVVEELMQQAEKQVGTDVPVVPLRLTTPKPPFAPSGPSGLRRVEVAPSGVIPAAILSSSPIPPLFNQVGQDDDAAMQRSVIHDGSASSGSKRKDRERPSAQYGLKILQ